MKEFVTGVLIFIASIITFTPIMFVGLLYSLGYSPYAAFKNRSLWSFFKYWWKMIDGTLAAIGFIFYQAAIAWDYGGNVLGGELMEDAITHHEDTKFTDKNTTISASIGELEIRGIESTNDRGKRLSKWLNIAFNQIQHAIDSWKLKVHQEAVRAAYFAPLRKKS